jgi:hypothetical protein
MTFDEIAPRAFDLALHFTDALDDGYGSVLAQSVVLGHRVQRARYGELPGLGHDALEAAGQGNFTVLGSRAWSGTMRCREGSENVAVLDSVVAGLHWFMASRSVWRAEDLSDSRCSRSHESVVLTLDPPEAPEVSVYALGGRDSLTKAVLSVIRSVLLREAAVRPLFVPQAAMAEE